MTTSDRLALLRAQTREWAAHLRTHALEVDHDPTAIVKHLGLPAVAQIARLQVPAEHNPDPLIIDGHRFYLVTATERVVFLEELAYGDLGMLLAAPGAAMAGVLVAAIGSRAQQQWFFARLRAEPTWTYFALTEPGHGSDAAAMETRLRADGPDGFLLTGAKRYVGNAVRGQVGVVFARSGSGKLGFAAALVERGMPGINAAEVPTIGLRAAQLGALTFTDVRIPADRVLGTHLPPSRRGMWGWTRTFNLLRPSVAAMGVGVARAAYEYVREERRYARGEGRRTLDRLGYRIEVVRALTLRAALAVDCDPANGHLASAAKVSAARLAEDVTRVALDLLGPGAVFAHPLLEKLARDARGIEFMEGTRNIQRLGLFGALQRGRLDIDTAAETVR